MNDTDMQIQWQEGSGESIEIGYLNPHGQKNSRVRSQHLTFVLKVET